jgi:hypothetical protein
MHQRRFLMQAILPFRGERLLFGSPFGAFPIQQLHEARFIGFAALAFVFKPLFSFLALLIQIIAEL